MQSYKSATISSILLKLEMIAIFLGNILTNLMTNEPRLLPHFLLRNVLISIVPDFNLAKSAHIALALQTIAYETTQREKESAICAPIRNEWKKFVSLSLGHKNGGQTETDRPGLPRSPNYLIRASFAADESCYRCDLKTLLTP